MSGHRWEVEGREHGDGRVLSFPERVDANTEESLRPTSQEALEAKPSVVVLDLDGVRYLNSAGLGLLFDLVRRAREREVPVALANVPARVSVLVHRLHLSHYAPIFDSVEDAVRRRGQPGEDDADG